MSDKGIQNEVMTCMNINCITVLPLPQLHFRYVKMLLAADKKLNSSHLPPDQQILWTCLYVTIQAIVSLYWSLQYIESPSSF